MNIICSPKGIVDIDRPAQGVIDISKGGFSAAVLDFSIKNIDLYIRKCAENKLALGISYAPFMDRKAKEKFDEQTIAAMVKESAEKTVELGINKIVVSTSDKELLFSLAKEIKSSDIRILLENQCRYVNGHLYRGLCSDSEEAIELIDELNTVANCNRFGFCLNLGTANLCGLNTYDFICALGDRLDAVIVTDNDGNNENYMVPFTAVHNGASRTNWLSLIRGLREIYFDGELILDMSDTAAAVSPMLRTGLMLYAKSTIDYIEWQVNIEKTLKKYDRCVLFGAGNMCRNYMKCYGKGYKPMFTCDNNKNIWGSTFEGLEVKNPEELKSLDEDVAIFICNIYYREIEEQLRSMGVKNPIEYFNDEYLPTFYFDRLEGDGRK